jgi:hypothetical protein
MHREKGRPKAAPKESNQHSNSIIDNSRAAQRLRLLKTLLSEPVTTILARDVLNILHPAGRVKELRDRGFDIRTHWLVVHDNWGRPHRVGCYVLHHCLAQQAA